MSVPATYFDGRQATAYPVEVRIGAGRIAVTGDAIARSEPIEAVEIVEALGTTSRLIRFSDGASCEIADRDAFARLLAEQGLAGSRVSRWERNRTAILAALALVVFGAAAGYRYGLPALARSTADALPASALDSISTQLLRALDATVFEPSRVPPERQAELVAGFARLKLPVGGGDRALQVQFRRSEALGANAIALPSGVIIVTDDLVDLATDVRELHGVLAHERGHVERRHGLRQVVQSSLLTLLITWYIGDVSALAAAAPAAILEAKYSRDLEREADAYAADVFRLNGLSLAHLADILGRLEAANAKAGRGADRGALSYLSSHPATDERQANLRGR